MCHMTFRSDANHHDNAVSALLLKHFKATGFKGCSVWGDRGFFPGFPGLFQEVCLQGDECSAC